MENKFQSIDSSIPHQSFDIKNAESNLRHLQDHVFTRNVHGTNWPVGTDMYCGHRTGLLEREDSVPEEAMFGNGLDESGGDSNDDQQGDTGSPCPGDLPHLSILNGSLGSSSSDDPKDSFKIPKLDRSLSGGEVEVGYRDEVECGAMKKSHKREQRYSSNMEVFEEEIVSDDASECNSVMSGKGALKCVYDRHGVSGKSYDERKLAHQVKTVLKSQQDPDDVFEVGKRERNSRLYRKSVSLPDLVLSSSGSSSSSVSASRSCASPDVTFKDDTQDALQRKDVKDIIEGPSTYGESQQSKYKGLKILLVRTVSFNEETVHNFFDNEGTEGCTERRPLKDGKGSLPRTPVTPEEKRIRFSQSSGYVTGSDQGSKEGASDKGSIESQSSQAGHPWTSNDSGSGSMEFSENVLNLIPGLQGQGDTSAGYQTPTDDQSKSFGSNTGSSLGSGSGSSHHSTVINSDPSSTSARSGMSVQGAESTFDNDFNGSADTDDKVDNIIPVLSIFGADEISAGFGPLTEKPTVVHRNMPQGPPSHTSNQPPSYSGSNQKSFSLRDSQIEGVAREDERIFEAFRWKYTGDDAANRASLQLTTELLSVFGAPASNQQQPLSVNDLTRRYLVEKINQTKEISPTSLQRLLEECIFPSDSSTPSPSPYETVKKQLSPDCHSFRMVDLERASRCTENQCKEKCCLKMDVIRRMLTFDLPELEPDYPLLDVYCRVLLEHSMNCEELVCPIQYCVQLPKWDSDARTSKQIVNKIQQQLVEPITSAQTEETEQIIKLQDELPNKQKEDFETSILALSQIGDFGMEDLLCCDEKSGHLYVQQTYPLFEASHQLALYTRLRNLKHPNIVNQLWLVQCEESIKVYTVFLAGGSLLEYIRLRGALPWQQTVHYMKQILTAVLELHRLGVVYLYWHSGNMVFPDCSRQEIKISGFGYSFPINCDSDLGATKQCLPYNLCPPELLREDRIDFRSDSWGAGCLMAEMLTGKPVWYKDRHEDRDTVHNSIRLHFPKVDTQTPSQRIAFEYCWQSQVERRNTIDELLEHLSSPK